MMRERDSVESRMIFRKTNAGRGRHVCVTPANSTNKHLSYARIILHNENVSFSNPGQETGLIVLSGSATVTAGGQKANLNRYDAIYIPRDASIEVSGTADIAEFSADVT